MKINQSLIVERMKDAKDWRSQLKAIVRANMDWIEKYPETVVVYVACVHEARRIAKLREFMSDVRIAGRKRMLSIIQEICNSHKVSAYKQEGLAASLQNIALGWVVETMSLYSDIDTRKLSREILDAMYAVVDGYCHGSTNS